MGNLVNNNFMQEAFSGIMNELSAYALQEQYNQQNGISVQPNTIGVDFFFLMGFITDEMFNDFPVIEQDFMNNCRGKLKEFNDLAWYDEAYIGANMPLEASYRYVLRLIYNGAKIGDEYCVELIKKLYKTYYKKEYNQVKRFSVIGMDDILDIVQDKNSIMEDMGTARVLAMAPFFNIKITERTAIVYRLCERKRDGFLELVDNKTEGIELSQEVIDEAAVLIDEWIDKSNKDSALAKTYKEVAGFIDESFRYHGFVGKYDQLCMNGFKGGREHLLLTLALLKTIYPKREFSFDEVQIYTNIRDLVIALTDTASNMDAQVGFLLGEEIEESAIEDSRFKPSSIEVVGNKVSKKDERAIATAPVNVTNVPVEEYLKAIDELRAKTNRLEHQNQALRDDLKVYKEKAKASEAMLGKYESERDELISLRNFAYNSTIQEDIPDEVSLEQMQNTISAKKIAIIGGHPNWLNKLKKKFPDWTYIQINDSSRYIATEFSGFDKVYFFTGFISHKDYNRYVAVLRRAGVAFGYMDGGVNIDKNVVQIYNDLVVELA